MTHSISRIVSRRFFRSVSRVAPALIAATLGLFALSAQASGGGVTLDHFPTEKLKDLPSLQNGAKIFTNYCLNCHGLSLMRYNRMTDLGLTEAQIRDNLVPTGAKVGDTMKVSMSAKDAKEWFGAMPPDLSVTARSRASHDGSGSDWLYTYLRGFYRDSSRATGWNNTVYPNVGMPHVLWELQGSRGASIEEVKAAADAKPGDHAAMSRTLIAIDAVTGQRTEKVEEIHEGHPHEGSSITLTPAVGGKLTQAQFDGQIADLVAYLTYVADPSAQTRNRLGTGVLLFLSLFSVLAWWLNREYWKDIK
jgi:ubiquinol-cytochrome c reductase cytochrome c1 subunit